MVFADIQVRFDCIFTRFADNCLWEYRIFSFKNECLAQASRVFPLIFHLFLLPEALQGFCEALGGIARLWEALEGSAGFARLCKALVGSLERLRKALGGFVT